jgi:type IV secretion system protein TrbL
MNVLIQTLLVLAQAYASQTSRRAPQTLGPATQRAWRLHWLLRALLVGLLYVLIVHPVHAATSPPVGGQTADFTLFDTLETDAQSRSNSWFTTIQGLVRPTFLMLGTIEICWAAAVWAFEKDNLNSLAIEVIKKFMFIGFFFTLLQYAPQWIPTITNTFAQVGATAAGTGTVTTDSIIATGLAVIKLIWTQVPTDFVGVIAALGKILVAAIVTIGIVIAYVILAAQYFTLKIESYILFAAGAIFLGLGSSSWTKEYVTKYLNYAINVGVRLLVLILILSLVASAVAQMGNSFTFDYVPLLTLLAASLLQAILGVKAPDMAGALLSGGIGLHAGSAGGAVGAAAGGMKTAVGFAMGGVGAAVSAMQGVGNLGKAVAAGREVAQQQGKSGMAANLSGLGMTAGQVAKELPSSLANQRNGGSSNSSGHNPGPIDRAKQNLQALAAAGAQTRACGSSGVNSSSSADAPGLTNTETGSVMLDHATRAANATIPASLGAVAMAGSGTDSPVDVSTSAPTSVDSGAPVNTGDANRSSGLDLRAPAAGTVQASVPGSSGIGSPSPQWASSAPVSLLRKGTAASSSSASRAGKLPKDL